MKIFHTSPSPVTKINNFGMFGECLCFSHDVYQMSSCEVLTYSLELAEEEVVEASEFFYREDCVLLNDIIEEIMDIADCDIEQARDYLSQADSHSDAEIDWRIQGYAGEAAKVLGFKAARAEDEQGTVYLVPMFGNEAALKLN